MKATILGGGCAKCEKLEENTRKAASEMGLDIQIDYVKDTNQIAEYGVTKLPALAVDDKVVSMGKVLKPDQIKKYLA